MGRHGENIHKRIDGRWEARIPRGKTPDGKTAYRYLYGKTYLEAKAKKQAALAENHPGLTAEDITFSQLTEAFMAFKRRGVKESTYAVYNGTLSRHLLPRFGSVRLQKLNAEMLTQFLCELLEDFSPKTVADIRTLLIQILRYGIELGYFLPARLPIAAPVQQPEIQVLSRREQRRLESVLYPQDSPLHLGVLVTLYTGLRIGELCALQWKDISIQEGTLQVSRTLQRLQNTEPGEIRTRVMIGEPKTASSRRVIPLPGFLLDILAQNQGVDYTYLLTGTPHPMEPRNCLARYKHLLKTAEVKDHTFHALRHTFATRCIESGFDVKSLSEIMGHSSVSITMQRYVHPSMERKREQMNQLAVKIHS